MIPEAITYAEVFVVVDADDAHATPFIVLGRPKAVSCMSRGLNVYQLHNALKVERADILINDELQRMVKDGK